MVGQLTSMDESDCGQIETQEWTDLGKVARSAVSAQVAEAFCTHWWSAAAQRTA